MFDPKLPGDPEAMIRTVLSDFLLVLNKPDKFIIDMGQYYTPNRNMPGKCNVCLAGASIAHSAYGTENANREVTDLESDTSPEQAERLRFIDAIARADELDCVDELEHVDADMDSLEDFAIWIEDRHVNYSTHDPYPFIHYVIAAADWWRERTALNPAPLTR